MAAYITLAAMVIMSIIGSTWHMSSRMTKLEMKVGQNSQKIDDLEKAVNNGFGCEEGNNGE